VAEAQIQQDAAVSTGVQTRSRRQDFIKTFLSNRLALFGMIIMAIFILLALFAPLVAPYDPLQQDLAGKFATPSAAHPFGQDELGRDILSRIIYGARISLTAGLAAVAIATGIGTLIGVVAGFFGGWLDSLLMRFMDVILAFPSILLAIVIVTVLGPSLQNAMIAIGIVFVPQMARVVRSAVISVRERDYIEAERALGAGNAQIILSGVLPNSMAPPRRSGHPYFGYCHPRCGSPLLPGSRRPPPHARVGCDAHRRLPEWIRGLPRGPARDPLPRHRYCPLRPLG
jgi:peptide/nickel transport system permease protein